MKRAILACTLAIAFAVLGCRDKQAPTAPAPGQNPPPVPSPVDPEVATFVALVNEHRVSIGLAPLAWDARVAEVAQAHSQDMVDRRFFSHTNPDGESPFNRLAEARITYTWAGENIAYGYPTASSVLAAWLNSPGHRANIENPNYSHHGVGLVNTYWTHVLIRPSTPPAARALASRVAGRAAESAPPPIRAP